MIRNKELAQLGYCRRCLSRTSGIKFKRKDVIICYYPRKCRCCEEVRNIVYSIPLKKRWKLLFCRHIT